MADFVGLIGGFHRFLFHAAHRRGRILDPRVNALEFSDLMQGMAKPVIFGFMLATVGCYKGLTVRGGTQGVGRATTQAVVISSVAILVSDFFLTKLALFLAGKRSDLAARRGRIESRRQNPAARACVHL